MSELNSKINSIPPISTVLVPTVAGSGNYGFSPMTVLNTTANRTNGIAMSVYHNIPDTEWYTTMKIRLHLYNKIHSRNYI